MSGTDQVLGPAQRIALCGIVVAHLLFPVLAAIAVAVWPHSVGSADATTLLALPVVFLVVALVVGPLVWRTWRGKRVAPWVLTSFIALEAWLYWNGSRTPSWSERSTNDRFSLAMAIVHGAAALAALAVAMPTLRPGRLLLRADREL